MLRVLTEEDFCPKCPDEQIMYIGIANFVTNSVDYVCPKCGFAERHEVKSVIN